MTNIITRFAPSPTGYLHLGNLRSAFFSFLLARQKANQNQGVFIIRIDDTDSERSKKIYTEAILKDLKWLGLNFDNIYTQSERKTLYKSFFEKLLNNNFIYECFETNNKLNDRKNKPYRHGDKRPLSSDSTLSYWRFRLPEENISWQDLVKGEQSINCHNFSDPVIRRSNGEFTYNFTSVCDDIKLGITHVVRGEDHTSNTAVQKAIFKALGSDNIEFAHLPFLVDSQGKSLSKRINSLSVKHFREEGVLPNAILSFIFSLGEDHTKILNIEQMIEAFDISKYCGAMPRIILGGLYSLNSKDCHKLDFTNFKNYWCSFSKAETSITEGNWLMVRENVSSLKDIHSWEIILGKWSKKDTDGIFEKINTLFPKKGKKVLETIKKQALDTSWNKEGLNDLFKTIEKITKIKGKPLFLSIRLVITKIEHGSNLQDIMIAIGKDEFLSRLNYVMENC